MEKLNYDKVNTTLQPIIDNCEKEDFKLQVTFFQDNGGSNSLRNTILKIKAHHVSGVQGYFEVCFFSHSRATNVIIGHVFRLDLDHIRILLESKGSDIKFKSIDDLNSFAMLIKKNYFEFNEWLSCFNGKGDDYDKIIEFIIKNRGSFFGERYGL